MDGPAKNTARTSKDPAERAWGVKCFEEDVRFLVENDFDAVKIDNCGGEGYSFTARFDAIQASGKKMLIENCNQGFGNPRKEVSV